MKRTNLKNSILVCALLGVLVAGQAQGATLRYQQSGDYLLVGNPGWQAGGGGAGGLPGAADTIRFNWGGNTVTLTNVAPDVSKFQMAVDEGGTLVVNNGGSLTATGSSTVGNNYNGASSITGFLTVNTGGAVTNNGTLTLGAGNVLVLGRLNGVVTVNGGTLRVVSHLWIGAKTNTIGTVTITNGGVVSLGANIGLGTINASSASAGQGFVNVQNGGVLNLANIDAFGNSIQPGSKLDISGSGVVKIPGDFIGVMSAYTNAGGITAFGGLGTVGIDTNVNVGFTTLFAIAPVVPPPTNVVWNPAANFPDVEGLWNVASNWTSVYTPASIIKATFNVVGAIPCTVTNAAAASSVDMGNTGPGGTLIITNGGSLVCGAGNPTFIGNNSNALMVVEAGGSASFGTHLWTGFDPGSDGMLTMNGGTVSVSGMFGLGWNGGKGTANINGGTLNLSQWQETNSIQGASVLNVAGTGLVVITGNKYDSVTNFVSSGKITANGGGGTVAVDYGNIRVGKTTIYVSGIYVAPEEAHWDPAANPSSTGKWNESTNWAGFTVPAITTKTIFNVPGATPCTLTNAAFARLVMGDNGPGGTLIITNGGNLTTTATDWSAIGYNSNALMVVESGGSVSFGQQLLIGVVPPSDGTLVMNGGTVSVAGLFRLGSVAGGKGTANINGGTLNLSQWDDVNSIQAASVLNVSGSGTVVINGDRTVSVDSYITSGQITANGGTNVAYSYDGGTDKTTITSAVLPPPPQQSVTAVTVGGGNVSLTYQTTAGYVYHVEGTPSLAPVTWTPVDGSTNTATGAPVTFVFPVGSGKMFYRSVSP